MPDFPYDNSAEIYEMGGLFPIPIMGKDVPVGGATGYEGTVTPEKVMQWLHPDARVRAKAGRGTSLTNVGLRHWYTLAIDVDHGYGVKNGVEQLAEYARKLSLSPLPPTWSSTARGDDTPSRQYIYSIEENFRAKTKPCKSVELCNWHHRFTVCAPSIHPKIGQPYAWYLPGEAGVPPTWGARTTRYPRHGDFTPLPADWTAAFRGTAANADRTVTTMALPMLLDSFTRGEPDGLVRHLLAKWGDETQHVGHDEAKNALINAFMLGREGHVGVHQLVDLLVRRLQAYLELDRPDKAQFEMYGDETRPGLIQAMADIAQQKPLNPTSVSRASLKVTVITLKKGDVPDPTDFMKPGVQFQYEDETPVEPARPDIPTVDTEMFEAFRSSFPGPGSERMAQNREVWLREAMRTAPHAIDGWYAHAVKALTDAIHGRYSADRAIELLTRTIPAGYDPDHLLRAALHVALDSLEAAA